ncbi:MAG: EAL domain-containing protein [Ilumatobacteraceae bacterium]|nr:EAL domain-containing protein [Ilumatobacteraceae bacterium]
MADIDEQLPSLPVGLFMADPDGRITAANEAFGALVHGPLGSVLGGPPWADAHPGDRASAELAWRRGVEAGGDISLSFRVWHGEGRMLWVRIDAAPRRDLDNRLVGFSGTALDSTDAVAGEQLLDRLAAVAGAADDAILILDRNGAPVFTNAAARELFGVEQEVDLIRDPSARGLLQAIRDQVPREIMSSSESTVWSGEVGFRGPDGLERTLDVDLLLHRSAEGIIEYWGGVAKDITATKHLQSELTRQANHDPLTGLPNRLMLLRTAADALDHIRGTRHNVAMLFVDVDRLKDVNDTVGHEVGDALLVQVAHRVLHATRPADVVARIGGDEFVVLCDGTIDEHTSLDLAERVRHALSGRVMLNGVEVELSVSIGVAIMSSHDVDGVGSADAAVELLRNADTAMYQAKRRGRSRSELYTEAMRAETRTHQQLSGELERALAAGQLRLAYQPIISTHSGRVAGAEALLRWDHPDRGALLPAQFLHIAEESGAIVPIGDWVIRQACLDARAWLDSGLVDRGFSVHVNVAARQLAEGTFVERVLATVRQIELSPHQLTLDFDEATLNDQQPGTLRSLQALRRFGVQLALDSFGTGVSSLTALRTCEADVLKLDGAIARMLGSNGDDDPIVRAIIQLAHALDMQVVGEWVTSADQLRRLRVLGCDLVQGHLIGEPTAADLFGASRRTSL